MEKSLNIIKSGNINFPLEDYISAEKFKKIKEFSKTHETPFLIIDLERINENYEELSTNLPFAKIYYAVKSNSSIEVLSLLRNLGSSFDVASIYELDLVLSLGVSPSKISYGNTIKKATHVKHAYEKGINLFATDSIEDLINISKNAPGAKVFFRILTDNSSADWPLSKKFGTHLDLAYDLAVKAKELGLIPYGMSFHVGSQQKDVGQWEDAIAKCSSIFKLLRENGIELKMINLGGGFPSRYNYVINKSSEYCTEIAKYLHDYFGKDLPEVIIEPGRSMVGNSGVIVSEIVLISKKNKIDKLNWVYLDIGKFGGLIETLDESIKYPIFIEKKGTPREVILAGPTCDSMDILYENYKYKLPSTIKIKDKVYIFTTGAYTQSYSSICFNGFPPLKSYIL